MNDSSHTSNPNDSINIEKRYNPLDPTIQHDPKVPVVPKDNVLIELKDIKKSFVNTEGQELLVLDSINFKLKEKEIVAFLGKSGSGKSTLLRIISGLIKPTDGAVFYRNTLIDEPISNIAMVFQTFALMPWLSVLENVELGLEAKGVPRKERRKRALKAIDTIGLDGFESAYPKELSGGMRQRVGFARALVVEPEILLMDEPFSALDILTAENLRNDLIDLWQTEQTHIKSILCVTHDIEEAILMADRIIIFSCDPGKIEAEIKVDFPHPRNEDDKEFKKLQEKIYAQMTKSERARMDKAKALKHFAPNSQNPEYAYRVPEAVISELIGFIESMLDHEAEKGEINLPELAEDLHLDIDNLFPITEVLDLLRFATIIKGELQFTEAGREFAKADILKRKQLFRNHLLKYIPLASHIREALDTAHHHKVSDNFFLEELKNHFSEDESERILKTIIEWGRYAEIFAYDYDSSVLSLENPQ